MCICKITLLSGTRKRRQRRQRAAARTAWYQHRTGQVPLNKLELLRIKSTLAKHHSRDSNFILTIQKHINMDSADLYPWKCSHCQRINKKIATKCVMCHAHWTSGTRHKTEPKQQQTYQATAYRDAWPPQQRFDWEQWEEW